MNRLVEIPTRPLKIISLVPSQTELLFDLGLGREIAGLTKFCIHPKDKVKAKTKIGGTKALDIGLIKEINPDLIIGNKEENERAQVEELMGSFPVWMSDINDLGGALDMITRVGEITGKAEAAGKLTKNINTGFDELNPEAKKRRVAYFIWRKPYMAAGKNTFIDAMLHKCGFINVFDADRYPEISAGELANIKPDVILLSSEPYPFKEKHLAEFKSLSPQALVKLVDGELFSWYGSRLLHAPGYFRDLAKQLSKLD